MLLIWSILFVGAAIGFACAPNPVTLVMIIVSLIGLSLSYSFEEHDAN